MTRQTAIPKYHWVLVVVLWLIAASSSQAHDAKYSSAQLLKPSPTQATEEVWFFIPPALLADWFSGKPTSDFDSNPDSALTWLDVQRQQAHLLGQVQANLSISDDRGELCSLHPIAIANGSTQQLIGLSAGATSDLITFGFSISCQQSATHWSWRGEQPIFLSIRSAKPDQSRVLGLEPDIDLAKQNGLVTMLVLGAEHLLFGFDHLLFLATLLLAAIGASRKTSNGESANTSSHTHEKSFASSAWLFMQLATVFTVAHSLTLGLASAGVINLPQEPVELIIAASILISVTLNYRPHRKKLQRLLVLFFGLIHGLGFAYMFAALLPANIARWDFVAALATFNAGIELAQLGVAVLALPMLYWLSRQHRLWPWLWHGSHAALAAAALLWMWQRI